MTENRWLYLGLAALMPEMICVNLRFSDSRLLDIIREAGRLLIVVDSRIILRGEWTALDALKMKRPDARLIWLILNETGRFFPEGNRGDMILAQRLDIVSLYLALKRMLSGFSQGEYVKGIELTKKEHCLLPYFASGLSMHEISQLTNTPVKTLYTHRQKILAKAGLRQPAFLHYVYKCNQGLPRIPKPQEQ